jgi:amino acid transporter
MSGKNNEVKLERKLGPLNVWSLALGCIIGWGAFVMPGTTFLPDAGPLGTVIAMAAATLIMIVIAFNYNSMINIFPVAGGEFTYTQKTFGEGHAFICSWFLSLSYMTIVPLNGTALALIGRNLMHNVFQVGFHYVVAGYDIYFGEIVLALGALILLGVMSIRGVEFTGIFQTLLVFVLIASIAAVFIAALVSPDASLENLSPGFAETADGKTNWGGILSVVAVAPWAFVGFDTIPQAAEEFAFPPKKTKAIMVVSIVFGGLIYVVLNAITAMTLPSQYSSWPEYIGSLPELEGLLSLPTFHAAYELLGTAGLTLLGLAVLAAILSGIMGFYMSSSRLLYSMSKEKVIPKWFGVLHPKFKTPANAIFFVMIISLIAPFFGRTALGWIVDMSSLGAAIGYGYTSAAAFVFARKKGDRFIMTTGILGTIFAIFFMILLLVPIPVFGCSLGKESYICLIAWIVIGTFFYLRSKSSADPHKKPAAADGPTGAGCKKL